MLIRKSQPFAYFKLFRLVSESDHTRPERKTHIFNPSQGTIALRRRLVNRFSGDESPDNNVQDFSLTQFPMPTDSWDPIVNAEACSSPALSPRHIHTPSTGSAQSGIVDTADIQYPTIQRETDPVEEPIRPKSSDCKLEQANTGSGDYGTEQTDQQDDLPHKKGEGCETWIPRNQLSENTLTCLFCGLPFTPGADAESSTCSSTRTTPLSDSRRSSFQEESDNDEKEREKLDGSRDQFSEAEPSIPSPYLRGGDMTGYKDQTWATRCNLHERFGFDSGTYERISARDSHDEELFNGRSNLHYSPVTDSYNPYPSSNADTKSISNHSTTSQDNEPPRFHMSFPSRDTNPYSVLYNLEDTSLTSSPVHSPSPSPSSHASYYPDDSTPSNDGDQHDDPDHSNDFGQEDIPKEGFFSVYALRQKMFPKKTKTKTNTNTSRNRDIAPASPGEIPPPRVQRRRRSAIKGEHARKVFTRFAGQGQVDKEDAIKELASLLLDGQRKLGNWQEGNESEKSDMWMVSDYHDVGGTENGVLEGAWVPETRAGPSERKDIFRGKRTSEEEYDGMGWGTY